MLLALRHGGYADVCHVADAGQGFPPEPQRGNGVKVLEAPQLAGGVPPAQNGEILKLQGGNAETGWVPRVVAAAAMDDKEWRGPGGGAPDGTASTRGGISMQ